MDNAMSLWKAASMRGATFAEGNESQGAMDDYEPSYRGGGDDLGFTSAFNSEEGGVDLRQNFVDSYGVDIEFPAYYSDSGVLVPHKPGFILSSGFHVIPRGNK